MSKIAFIFSGQGSQYSGMGMELFNRYNEVKNTYLFVDEILGRKISDICFNSNEEVLAQTINTQPSIFTLSISICNLLKKYNIYPDVVAGYSLGEYSALYAAGVFDLVSSMFLINKRAIAMDRVSKNDNELGMGVISGKDIDKVIKICSDIEGVYVSNYNTERQISISGKLSAIQKAFKLIEAYKCYRTMLIPVSGAFHSPYMKEAADEYRISLNNVRPNKSKIPLILNTTGEILKTDDDIKEIMLKQIVSPVKWNKSVNTMLDMGVDIFIELGPGRTLSKYMKTISNSNDIKILNVENMQSLTGTIDILNS